jgi:multiple sugar transport system permease protein
MAGPGLLLCLAMSVIVVTNAVWLIVHHENLLSPQHQFVGASELRQLLNDHTLRGSLVVTVVYVATALPIEVALGVGISLLLHYGVRGGRVVRSLIIVPMVLAPLIVGLIWRMIYDPSAGLLDYFLREVSLPSGTAWLANPHTALWGIILADVWQWTPFIIIITVAALESLPVDPFEAAQIDGAGTFQTVRHLTLPLLQPALAIAVFLRLIGLVNSFASIWAMTMGGPGTTTMGSSCSLLATPRQCAFSMAYWLPSGSCLSPAGCWDLPATITWRRRRREPTPCRERQIGPHVRRLLVRRLVHSPAGLAR